MNSYRSTQIESLTDALMELNTSEELGKLARLAGSRPPTRKADLADHIARFLARDTHTRRHCMLAGSRHLVVPRRSEAAFKRGLKKVGFVVRWTADGSQT